MSAAERMRVGLLFGGRSGEHEISIRSAHSVANAIDRGRFDVTLIGIDRAGSWHLYSEDSFARVESEVAAESVDQVALVPRSGACGIIDLQTPARQLQTLDVVFPVLHGPYGEDGTLQGLLEMMGVPYVGSGVLGSAIGMDKDIHKRLLRDAGIPIVPFGVVTQEGWNRDKREVRARAHKLGSPIFVKPANLGSSVGISKVDTAGKLEAAIEQALMHDRKILLERAIDGREIECAVLGNDEPRASLPGEIIPGEEFYSYSDKYAPQSKARLLIPAPISEALQESVRALAVRVFQTLECCGMARIDFFLERGSDRIYVNEPNTIPGFTSISMYPKLWEASGLPYRDLTTCLIDLAIERHRKRTTNAR